jgi:hypothetical protein
MDQSVLGTYWIATHQPHGHPLHPGRKVLEVSETRGMKDNFRLAIGIPLQPDTHNPIEP